MTNLSQQYNFTTERSQAKEPIVIKRYYLFQHSTTFLSTHVEVQSLEML